MEYCEHNQVVGFCLKCWWKEKGVQFYLPPELPRAITLYDARKELYLLYEKFNKEHFEGKLPWVRIYLNGRVKSDVKVKLVVVRSIKNEKPLLSVSIEMSDRSLSSLEEGLLSCMTDLNELLTTGKIKRKKRDKDEEE